ncbi:ABC transporter ATP-binding protein [Gynuella sunshinyii]|uniref:ABC-type antimicrobial peptide transport system, ATPase component n=1 Tax=Gynuella sunshinyii YC6258 TaxID=1445510 RepID=A0A0C5VR13_9GAMM|nr:ABC transporter ATP-binding protein [Gynuella sunshinyii]AJQ95838.1 ABC-type antimicrobial peptide transport system, ATPase component [Gynuella sunshinyii YC6258]
MSNELQVVLECRNLSKEYSVGPERLKVLNGLSVVIRQGELVSVVGASGSGKTTLLNLLAGLDQSSDGEIFIAGHSLTRMGSRQRDQLRNRDMGFVFQFHHLLPEFTALENVILPAWLGGKQSEETYERGKLLLQQVGLGQRYHHKPSELSGGERQRVAIARSLINSPRLVLMDEPTGNLDEETAGQIRELIFELNQQVGTSFIIVTHSRELAQKTQIMYRLKDGRLEIVG